MKKNKIFGELVYRSLKKIFLVMRIAIIFLVLGVLQAHASDAYSQKTRLSLDIENSQLSEVLSKIEEESEFFFLYNEKLIDLNRSVNITVENQLIDTILDDLFADTKVKYTIIDRKIILAPEYLSNAIDESIAQQQNVTGVVTDASTGEVMPGVNVLVKGTVTGSLTDSNGKFSIPVNDRQSAVLVFSFIGFSTQEITLNGRAEINIALAPAITGLDEVVVIGYGTSRRADLTGSVGSVTASALEEIEVTNIEQSLLGKIAGVQVKPADGTPGASPQIIVRGIGSLSAGTEPLYVVDGFPVTNLSTLNPDDISSIDILKDASATAIYGSRGSNGVVIISTKRGEFGSQTKLDFDISYGLQKVSNVPEYMNAAQMAEYAYWGSYFRTLDLGGDLTGPPETWKYPVPQMALDIINGVPGTPDVDWFDEVLRVAPVVRYQLSTSGGTENTSFIVSGEYTDQQGIIIGSEFKRYSARANIDLKLTKKLALQINLNPTLTRKSGEDPQGTGYGTSILGNAACINPYTPAYDENGDYFVIDGLRETGNFPNPVALANEIIDRTTGFRFIGNINSTYKISNDFTFKMMLGGNYSDSKRLRYVPKIPSLLNSKPTGYDYANFGLNWITEYTLNYAKTVGEHNLAGLLGFTAERSQSENNFLQSTNFPNNLIPYLNAAGGILTNGGAGISESALLSYLGRVAYDYGNKYYITTSLRADGSSRFGLNNRYGYFPSVALAWRISEKTFMQNIDFIDNLKLRLSYGQTGNNNIGNYASLARLSNINYPLDDSPVGGFILNSIANPNLTWEKQSSFNIGFDLVILKGRVNLVIDNFKTLNKSLLLNVNIPSITGYTSALQNIGEIQNKGWEIGINTVNVKSSFSWTTDFNITLYRNKVLKLGPEGSPIISSRHITMIGEPIGVFYGLVQDGIFETEEEYVLGPYYNPGGSNRTRLGDIKFKDFSGPNGTADGKIDSYDRVIIGSPYPDFYYGMTNNFSYKNFNLSVSLQGVKGNQIAGLYADVGGRNEFRVKQLAEYADFWKSEEEPGNGLAQRPNDEPTGGIREFSTQKLRDGSYMRINNISFGYEVPKSFAQKLNLSSLYLYLNANNPITFTEYGGFNPDVSRSTNPLLPGEDNNNYPLAKTWRLGLKVGF